MNNSIWTVCAKRADFKQIADTFGIDQVTARIIRNRDITGEDAIRTYLYGTLADLTDPHLLGNAREAARMLLDHIRRGRKVRIIGDYDIDGVCAACILYQELQRHGADVDVEIPDRIRDGYGLHMTLIERAHRDGIDTILTCDNGISAIEEIEGAKKMGMHVIVTDHHQCAYSEENGERIYRFPHADVLVNPHIPGDPYPDPGICGTVVAWKVMQLLRELVTGKRELCDEYLELAAIATIGDVMDLRGENRIIVKEGLRCLEKTKNTGLAALLNQTGLDGKELTAYHVGYILGPCINASGRLDTAKKALRLLLCDNRQEAEDLAAGLSALNAQRKELTQKNVELARKMVEEQGLLREKVFVLYLPSCHESIAGIVAGKVRELYEHPAFILTDSAQPGILKGSGRSIEAYPMVDSLAACSEYLIQYGGHPMAAGLTIEEEKLTAFTKALNVQCCLTDENFRRRERIDVPMPLDYITADLIREFSCLEPCGKGNEKPLFAQKDVCIRSIRILGRSRNVVKMALLTASGHTMEGLCFNDPDQVLSYLSGRFGEETLRSLTSGRFHDGTETNVSILYYPQINTFRGTEQIQVIIRDLQ